MEEDIKHHVEGNRIIFDETRLLLNGDQIEIDYILMAGNGALKDVSVILKGEQMKRLLLYKVKGYNFDEKHKFKEKVAASSFAEAAEIAYQLAGSEGWVESIKDTNKDAIVKGES